MNLVRLFFPRNKILQSYQHFLKHWKLVRRFSVLLLTTSHDLSNHFWPKTPRKKNNLSDNWFICKSSDTQKLLTCWHYHHYADDLSKLITSFMRILPEKKNLLHVLSSNYIVLSINFLSLKCADVFFAFTSKTAHSYAQDLLSIQIRRKKQKGTSTNSKRLDEKKI